MWKLEQQVLPPPGLIINTIPAEDTESIGVLITNRILHYNLFQLSLHYFPWLFPRGNGKELLHIRGTMISQAVDAIYHLLNRQKRKAESIYFLLWIRLIHCTHLIPIIPTCESKGMKRQLRWSFRQMDYSETKKGPKWLTLELWRSEREASNKSELQRIWERKRGIRLVSVTSRIIRASEPTNTEAKCSEGTYTRYIPGCACGEAPDNLITTPQLSLSNCMRLPKIQILLKSCVSWNHGTLKQHDHSAEEFWKQLYIISSLAPNLACSNKNALDAFKAARQTRLPCMFPQITLQEDNTLRSQFEAIRRIYKAKSVFTNIRHFVLRFSLHKFIIGFQPKERIVCFRSASAELLVQLRRCIIVWGHVRMR